MPPLKSEDFTQEFGTYQHHRFGPRSSKDDLYLDVMLPEMRWCVRSKNQPQNRAWPRVNTWRSAYGLLRRIKVGKWASR